MSREATAYIVVRISPTIANEYANRLPEGIPEAAYEAGKASVSLADARVMLSDAQANCDPKQFDVGPYGMPLGCFNAYRALAKQLRAAIDEATCDAASSTAG